MMWLQRHPDWADALTGVCSSRLLVIVSPFGVGEDGIDPAGYVCCAAAGLAFAVRRRFPVATLALVAAAITTYGLTGQPDGPIHLTSFAAALQLLGRANWWMPRWLDRAVPRLAPDTQ